MHIKKLALFILCFVVMQTLAFSHMAEHGFEGHEHDGKECELNYFYDAGKSLDKTDEVLIESPKLALETNDIIYNSLTVFSSYRISSPREPPYFS